MPHMLATLASIMIATSAACKWGAPGDIHSVPVHGYTWWSCGPLDGTKTYSVKAAIRSTVGDTYDYRFGQDGSKTSGPAHSYLYWYGGMPCQSIASLPKATPIVCPLFLCLSTETPIP